MYLRQIEVTAQPPTDIAREPVMAVDHIGRRRLPRPFADQEPAKLLGKRREVPPQPFLLNEPAPPGTDANDTPAVAQRLDRGRPR